VPVRVLCQLACVSLAPVSTPLSNHWHTSSLESVISNLVSSIGAEVHSCRTAARCTHSHVQIMGRRTALGVQSHVRIHVSFTCYVDFLQSTTCVRTLCEVSKMRLAHVQTGELAMHAAWRRRPWLQPKPSNSPATVWPNMNNAIMADCAAVGRTPRNRWQ